MKQEQLNISNAIVDYMMPYSKHVITERAIVDLRDGLKPSQRLGLWSMYEAGLNPNKKRMKSVGVSGLTLKYHPHSDQSAYETLSRLAQSDSLLLPLIDAKGNMGQRTSRDVGASAMRYTEMRLSDMAMELFKNINKNAVDMLDNFDGSLKQPEVLPSTFPSALIFGSSGIAVGMSSEIPSFNLSEVCQYTIDIIQGKVVDNLIPDFATGGKIIYDENELYKTNNIGNGKLKLRANWYKNDNIIIIDEIPYTTTREAIIDRIIQLVKDNKLKEITDILDATDLQGMKIEITAKKGVDIESLMAKLYVLTPLESNFNCNMNIIYNDKPIKMGVKNIVESWVSFRKDTVRRITEFELSKENKELLYLYALDKVVLDIDKAVDVIKKSKTEKEAIEGLMNAFNIKKEEAELVANIRLRNLNKSYIASKTKSIKDKEKIVETLTKMLKSEKLIDNYIIKDLKRVMEEYGKPRITEIIYDDTVEEYIENITEDIPDYNVKFFITKENYLKKIPLTSLRSATSNKIKDGDEIIDEIETTNLAEVLIFTDKCNVYKLKAHEIEDCKPSSLGEYLPTLLELRDENILYTTVTDDFKGFVIICYSDGKIAKINASSYATKTNRTKLANAYADKSPLLFKYIQEDIDIIAVSSIDKVVLMNTSTINPKSSRNSQGNVVIKQKKDSSVKGYYLTDEVEFEDIEYYRIKNAGVGKYLKSNDIIVDKCKR